jgi:hypothetical protein
MKTKLTLLTAGLLIINHTMCLSQKDSSGIYFKANDYIHHNLSYAQNCNDKKSEKINTDVVFHSNEISVKHNGTTYKLKKDSVYAVKYCDGSIVRIYNKVEYPIVNPGEHILIYKVVAAPSSKGESSTTKYYFSKDAKGNIQELTISNLEKTFSKNKKFQSLIEEEFHSDADLTSYDNVNKMMKINKALENSREAK